MAESSFRSKHAGKPGSLIAIRVDYPLSSNAFEPLAPGSEHKRRHEEIDKFIRGPRIGDKTDWNASAIGPMSQFPHRPLMRQNHEFMGVKMEYNYRAATLPTMNHDTTFVPRPNKMQVDRSLFLSPAEKQKLVKRCPGTAASLSRAPIGNGPVPGVELESKWNVSTQLDEDRANIFKTVKYASLVDKNKTKGILNGETYVTPVERVATLNSSMRSLKLSQRGGSLGLSALRSADANDGAGSPAVYKMSNMSEWWNKCPIDLPAVMTDESAIEKMSDGQ
jgi:hypothetical protein